MVRWCLPTSGPSVIDPTYDQGNTVRPTTSHVCWSSSVKELCSLLLDPRHVVFVGCLGDGISFQTFRLCFDVSNSRLQDGATAYGRYGAPQMRNLRKRGITTTRSVGNDVNK